MPTLVLVALYIAVALCFAAVAALIGTDPGNPPHVQRACARVALLAMVWPVLIVYAAARAVGKVWATAQWGR